MEWSIIIFCYNEEKNIAKVIQNTIDFLLQPENENSEIIVVNDGSSDESATIIDLFKYDFPQFSIIHLPKNRGIGNALNTGYDCSKKEFVCAIPGDGQFDISELEVLSTLDKNQFATFYRTNKNYDIYRALLTKLNYLFNRFFLNIHVPDVNWIKVYQQHQIDRKMRTLNSSLVESEIVAKLIKEGYTHIDYPSKYLKREYGIAKGGNWHTLKKAISEVSLLFFIIRSYSKGQ